MFQWKYSGRFHLFALTLCLIPWSLAAGELSFRVVDSKGLPVPGAVLEVLDIDQNALLNAGPTDSDGRTTVSVMLPITVSVQTPGFEPLDRKIDTAPAGDIILRLVSAVFHVSVEVMVTDTPQIDGPVERNALAIERRGARTVYDAIDKLIPSAHVPGRGIWDMVSEFQIPFPCGG